MHAIYRRISLPTLINSPMEAYRGGDIEKANRLVGKSIVCGAFDLVIVDQSRLFPVIAFSYRHVSSVVSLSVDLFKSPDLCPDNR